MDQEVENFEIMERIKEFWKDTCITLYFYKRNLCTFKLKFEK